MCPESVDAAIVLWSGGIGGSEVHAVALAGALMEAGCRVGVVFVTSEGALGRKLRHLGVAYTRLGLARGFHVLRQPHRLARATGEMSGRAAIVSPGGFMCAALRAGGYRGRIIGIENGSLMHGRDGGLITQFVARADRVSAVFASDAEVAVSDHVLSTLEAVRHSRLLRRIYNGVDVERLAPQVPDHVAGGPRTTMGCVARLRNGKGVEKLVKAFAAQKRISLLRIAGDGPRREALEDLAAKLGVAKAVEFVGWTDDVAEFWRRCDFAAVPSELPESFCMAAAEAMACGRPVIASGHGALPEVVENGVSGVIVRSDSAAAWAAALPLYADIAVRDRHGRAARRRAEEVFDIRRTAREYISLLEAVYSAEESPFWARATWGVSRALGRRHPSA